MAYRDLMNDAERRRSRRRKAFILGLGAIGQGGQYAFRPAIPATSFPALDAWGQLGWIVLGAVLAAAGFALLVFDNSWPAHMVAATCYLVLAYGQATSPKHIVPFVLVALACLHAEVLWSVRDVWARLGIGPVGRRHRGGGD